MAEENELKTVFDMFTESWRFYKRFADAQKTDEYWKAVTEEGDRLRAQFGGGRLVRDLLGAVVAELERRSKEVRDNADTAV